MYRNKVEIPEHLVFEWIRFYGKRHNLISIARRNLEGDKVITMMCKVEGDMECCKQGSHQNKEVF